MGRIPIRHRPQLAAPRIWRLIARIFAAHGAKADAIHYNSAASKALMPTPRRRAAGSLEPGGAGRARSHRALRTAKSCSSTPSPRWAADIAINTVGKS